jgi:hypothetical protein
LTERRPHRPFRLFQRPRGRNVGITEKWKRTSTSIQAPSRVGKKAIIGYFDPSVSKQLKQIGLDKDLSVQDLLSEAINDLFHKYRKPNIA